MRYLPARKSQPHCRRPQLSLRFSQHAGKQTLCGWRFRADQPLRPHLLAVGARPGACAHVSCAANHPGMRSGWHSHKHQDGCNHGAPTQIDIAEAAGHANEPARRRWLLAIAALLCSACVKQTDLAMTTTMNAASPDIWHTISALAEQLPLSSEKVRQTLGTALTEATDLSNEYFAFYRGGPASLGRDTTVAAIDLRLSRTGTRPGFLVLHLSAPCIGIDEVRARYPALAITEVPRGDSPNDQTVWSTEPGWGRLSFGFAERQPGCLTTIILAPARCSA